MFFNKDVKSGWDKHIQSVKKSQPQKGDKIKKKQQYCYYHKLLNTTKRIIPSQPHIFE